MSCGFGIYFRSTLKIRENDFDGTWSDFFILAELMWGWERPAPSQCRLDDPPRPFGITWRQYLCENFDCSFYWIDLNQRWPFRDFRFVQF